MDFELLFMELTQNWENYRADLITKEERQAYVNGVFTTLRVLGLRRAYDEWCKKNDILIEETPT